MHGERALYDAILVGTNTVIIDNPSLTTRLRPGRDAMPVTFDSNQLPAEAKILQRPHILLPTDKSLKESIKNLYSEQRITSLMVEGGAETLSRFIDDKLFDEIRIEISDQILSNGVSAPRLPRSLTMISERIFDKNRIFILRPEATE